MGLAEQPTQRREVTRSAEDKQVYVEEKVTNGSVRSLTEYQEE